MTRRAQTNDRYAYDNKHGQTKKSASSAKPAKEAASTVYERSGKRSRKEQREYDRQRYEKRKALNARRYNEIAQNSTIDIEDKNERAMKRWRKIWWAVLAAGIAMVVFSWNAKDLGGYAFIAVMVVAYGLVAFALFIEFGIIWKLRKKTESSTTERKSAKQIKHELEEQRLAMEEAAVKRSKRQEKSKVAALRRKVTHEAAPHTGDYPLDESSEG